MAQPAPHSPIPQAGKQRTQDFTVLGQTGLQTWQIIPVPGFGIPGLKQQISAGQGQSLHQECCPCSPGQPRARAGLAQCPEIPVTNQGQACSDVAGREMGAEQGQEAPAEQQELGSKHG